MTSSVTDIADTEVHLTAAGNSVVAELFGGFLSNLQKGRSYPALRLS
jgi:hypothetical protein